MCSQSLVRFSPRQHTTAKMAVGQVEEVAAANSGHAAARDTHAVAIDLTCARETRREYAAVYKQLGLRPRQQELPMVVDTTNAGLRLPAGSTATTERVWRCSGRLLYVRES